MTDEELAVKCAERSDTLTQRGKLLGLAYERLYALSAHVALLKASLAQAEREAEKPAASAEPVSDLARRVAEIAQSHIGSQRPGADEPEEREYWDMCQRVIDAPAASAEPVARVARLINTSIIDSTGCKTDWEDLPDGTPLYASPQPDRVAELDLGLRLAQKLLSAERETTKCLGVDVDRLRGERDALTADVERLRAALVASCEDEREQIYEAGPSAGGCPRATAAESEVERLRKDAERYRWLRDAENQRDDDDICVQDGFYEAYFGQELDSVIDLALAGKEAAHA